MHVCVCSWKSGANACAKAPEEQGAWYILIQKESTDLRCAETKENMNKREPGQVPVPKNVLLAISLFFILMQIL